MQVPPKIIIAIPVKNEEARISHCLNALASQAAEFDQLLLLLNNCSDRTYSICTQYARRFAHLRIIHHDLQGNLASAGEARRLALEYATNAAGDGIILTTDADAVPDASWVADNLREMDRGAELVCGMARLDDSDAASIPKPVRADEKNEARLMGLQDEIAAMIDPDPADPWPRHQHHSGASLSMRASILRSAGGAPHVAIGEDRALVERLRLVDARIRHAPNISVRVSGRLEGRAEGGMAATLKRRLQQRDILTDERLEPTVDAYRRVLAKARLRAVVQGSEKPEALAEDLLISLAAMRHSLRTPFFGAAWANIQRLSPVLKQRRVAFSSLQREIAQALTLRAQLRTELSAAQTSHSRRSNEGNFSSDENAQ